MAKSDTAAIVALMAIPVGAMAAFLVWKMVAPSFGLYYPHTGADMKGYIFDANTMSCETCGR